MVFDQAVCIAARLEQGGWPVTQQQERSPMSGLIWLLGPAFHNRSVDRCCYNFVRRDSLMIRKTWRPRTSLRSEIALSARRFACEPNVRSVVRDDATVLSALSLMDASTCMVDC